jgi:hypothetical protein
MNSQGKLTPALQNMQSSRGFARTQQISQGRDSAGAALAMLGPEIRSVDARLFGRK